MKGLAITVGLVFATSAAADQSCEHAPLIAQMSDYILSERGALPPPQPSRYGATAAFMQIQYGGADPVDVMGRIEGAELRRPRLYDDMIGAYALSQPGGLADWSPSDPEVVERVVDLLPSTRRALVLADEGETYLALVAAVRATPALAQRYGPYLHYGTEVAFAIADQPEDVRIRVAERAEAAGELRIAAALLGDLEDRALFDALLARHADNADFVVFDPAVILGYFSIGALNRRTPLGVTSGISLEAVILDLQIYTVQRALVAGTPSDYLNIYLNQSGRMVEATLAAQTYLAQIDAGVFDPVADPEAAWVAVYEALLDTDDPQQVQQVLGSFEWPSQSIRWYAGLAHESLDVMVAKDAFGPYMRAESDTLPTPPDGFAGTLDWADWSEVATWRSQEDFAKITPDTRPIAVELMWEIGAYADAVSIAAGAEDLSDRLRFMRDAMVRLDALCGPTLGLPGGAIRYGGAAVYRFD